MKPAFWDTSAIVPLCVQQKTTPVVRSLLSQYQIVVWWATSVEVCSAFERLVRVGDMTVSERFTAGLRLERLRRGWREVQPSQSLRSEAQTLLGKFPLKAADSLQLAAAWVWAFHAPHGCVLISADEQLLRAAMRLGFQVVAV